MGINPKGCFLGDMGRKILVIFQDKKVGNLISFFGEWKNFNTNFRVRLKRMFRV
jgi:hypothetical protein